MSLQQTSFFKNEASFQEEAAALFNDKKTDLFLKKDVNSKIIISISIIA